MTENDQHVFFMKEAMQEAKEGLARREVPVGCVFVRDNEIIARGSNRVNELFNATKHAEIVALEAIAAKYGARAETVLREATLYVTGEPCMMCASALAELGIARCYYGCHNDRFGGCGSVLSLHEPSETSPGFPCVSGIMEQEAIAMIRSFYDVENPRVEESKRKHRK